MRPLKCCENFEKKDKLCNGCINKPSRRWFIREVELAKAYEITCDEVSKRQFKSILDTPPCTLSHHASDNTKEIFYGYFIMDSLIKKLPDNILVNYIETRGATTAKIIREL